MSRISGRIFIKIDRIIQMLQALASSSQMSVPLFRLTAEKFTFEVYGVFVTELVEYQYFGRKRRPGVPVTGVAMK
jgi:hypothetical protein